MINERPRCLRGRYGVYLAYYLAEKCWIRLMGNLLEESDSWVWFEANPDSWLPLCALHIAVWEANTDWYDKANFESRDDAWTFARTSAAQRKRPTLHNEWFEGGHWHVNSIHPKAVA